MSLTRDQNDDLWSPQGEARRRRIERQLRDQRRSWERTRDRVARERKRPWLPEEAASLRKRLWSERRAYERMLLEQEELSELEEPYGP